MKTSPPSETEVEFHAKINELEEMIDPKARLVWQRMKEDYPFEKPWNPKKIAPAPPKPQKLSDIQPVINVTQGLQLDHQQKVKQAFMSKHNSLLTTRNA